ncbi:MAG: MBG domain-containing protein, partial [Eubacteriales bacterium]|nr:MBG domain-containing protein [Eubacteriales bacterium]
DESGHWHESTCGTTAPTHDVMKRDFAAHTFDDGVVTKPADFGVAGEKKFTCTECGYSYTQEIPALAAKDNAISFANDLVDEKTYDGLAFIIDPAKVNRKGDGEITITYKGENDTAFSETAPINAGEYTVKATVKGTAEWKGGEITTTIIINKREITLPAGVFERKLGENLESGKFGLTCINVAADTNNVVEWVTIGAPETYYAIGIHTISATVLTVDNDNFELNKGVYDTVRFTVWNAPDSFYAGIKDVFTFPGNSDVMINTIIANGTVKKGDQILVNEIGKIITVNKIEKDTGTSVTEVETATAGEEVGLRISEGVTKAELNRGYMLSKPDTIIGYSKVTVTIRVYAKDEGNTAPIATGNKMVAFADTFGEVTGGVTLPEGTDIIRPGEIIENVTINFQDGKVPAFVGRRFTLKNSGKTIAECIVTAVPNATRVRSGFMLGVPGTNVIEPIELGENTFAVNLNRSDLGEMLKNAKDTDTIELKFINGGKDIAKYTRTPGTGEGVYNEVGGRIVGSYLIVEFYKNTGSDPKLTGNNGEWVFTGDDIFIGIGVYITPASGT